MLTNAACEMLNILGSSDRETLNRASGRLLLFFQRETQDWRTNNVEKYYLDLAFLLPYHYK